jgi:hypothetical protein
MFIHVSLERLFLCSRRRMGKAAAHLEGPSDSRVTAVRDPLQLLA